MCYSAIVQQSLHTLSRRYVAAIDWGAYERLFTDRADGRNLYIPRALDQHILGLNDSAALRSQQLIGRYRDRIENEWQQELFKQRKRAVDGERKLAAKETKTTRKDLEIARRKVEAYSTKLKRLRSPELDESDSRIFSYGYAPVVVSEAGQRWIRPMRYLCRLPGTPASTDRKYPGIYNARRDNLGGFWSPLFAKQHGIIVVDSFFENVPKHLYERRELASGEEEQNMVLHFNPNTGVPMIIACLWSRWTGEGEPSLDSFAAITDDPPKEILETGHTRCIISIREQNVNDWLSPAVRSTTRLEEILSDKVMPLYEHVIEQEAA